MVLTSLPDLATHEYGGYKDESESERKKVKPTWSAWMTLTSLPELATPPTNPSPHGITTGSTAWE